MEPPKAKITISSISSKTGITAPFIGTFLNGDIVPKNSDKIKCRVKRDSNNAIEKVKITTDKFTYTNIENTTNDDFRSFIAIRNKTTNKMRLIELEKVLLKPIVASKEPPVTLSEITSKSRRSKINELNLAFGTKKSRKLLERRNKMECNIDKIKDKLNKTAASKSITEMELSLARDQDVNQHYMDSLPPCNRNASTAEDIYLLKDIIDEVELNSLSETAEHIMENQNTLSEHYKFSQFFITCLNAMPSRNDQKQKVCLLLYAEGLLQIANLTNKPVDRKFKPCPYSETINNKIIMQFTNISLNERLVATNFRDRALCHILVILFLVFPFYCNLDWLLTSYSGGKTRIKQLMRVVGGTNTDKKTNIYMLKLPLPPLPGSKGPSKKRY